MKFCVYCKTRPAEVPDRNNYNGRFIKKVCLCCQEIMLRSDLKNILNIERMRQKQREM